ncbi:NAD(P)/FAD-dependent oxidoreductase [Pseudoroseomonas cervicalis]|uniref:NAD(P)/FAD-dependent oxidoreductase n=1 Tax=Teichococcus cervicalis TaxID=204525 RepID=UPI002788A15A|nr:NAD(P)/FAD-dependent oxidoreductase [Pseudoroseomonas cervicalis]MDQ1079066.1 pyruvate/2-oxoglutarate dehydrogenase complex dihydrolipoamide dehydrogenase (E3) component [Pseudoroseomonas cervicalis]
MPDHDVAIIGAGAAGRSVAATAASLGLTVVLFERDRLEDGFGRGKAAGQALLAAAHRAAALRGTALGIRAEGASIDWTALRRHLREAGAAALAAESAARPQGPGITLVQASAHFVAPDRIEAAGRVHSFRRAVIAAGRAPVVPDLPGLVGLPWLTRETLLELEEPPRHLLVLGGGATGMEMAQAHARLGCKVTLIEAAPNILSDAEPEFRLPLREQLRQDGVEILENSRAVALEPAPDGLAVVMEGGARLAGSHLLFAVGHAPRLAPLDLPAANIAATPRGIDTGRDLRSTSNRRIWAAGDIADPQGVDPRHASDAAGQHAALLVRSMLFRLPARLDDAALPRLIGTAPELAQIGLTEAEARAAGHSPRIQRQGFTGNLRAIAEGDTAGMVKLVLDGQGRLLGAGLLGRGAGELAAALGLMIGRRLPLSALAELPLASPSRAEALRQAAAALYTSRLTRPIMRRLAGWATRLP